MDVSFSLPSAKLAFYYSVLFPASQKTIVSVKARLCK